MTSAVPTDDSPGDAGRSNWRPWQDVIGQRLSRSTTVALLLSPLGLLVISVARLLIVSDYNTVTASAVVSSGGYVDALLGTVIPLVPLALPYLALILLFFNRVILSIISLAGTLFISPVVISGPAAADLADKDWHHIIHASVVITVIMGLLAVSVLLLLLAVLVGLGANVLVKAVATILCIAFIPFVSQLYSFPMGESFYTQLIREPWLPSEMITFTSGQRIIGYVLSDSGSSVAVLKSDNRAVYYYPDSTVAGRQICELSGTARSRPIITILPPDSEPSRTPVCRSSPASLRPPVPDGGSRGA